MKKPFSLEDKEIEPPKEILCEERQFTGFSDFCSGHTSRESLIGSRLSNFSWFRDEDQKREEERVFVYKFSHVEIIKKKLEIIIEKPKDRKK